MKEYGQALRDWFYARAFIPSYYGAGQYPDDQLTQEFHDHIRRCGLVWFTEPDLGSVKGFSGSFTEDLVVPGIRAQTGCRCDRYEKEFDEVTLFIPGKVTLSDIIAQVIKEGETG